MEYISALTPLISALAEAQSSAVQGVSAAPDSLVAAVARVTAVDNSIGDALKTRERWADLQAKIGKLPKATGGTVAVLQQHIEVSDLTLALYAAVRRNSELSRDPASDVSNLQQAVAIDMPKVVSQVSLMGDLANMLQSANPKLRATIAIQFGQEVLNVQDSVNDLTEGLQAAVDDTSSSTLSGSLVSTLDSFRRGVEAMTRGANPGGTPNVATMSTAQTALQTSLTALAGVTLKEMTKLLDDRSDSLAYRRGEAVVMGLLAILLAIGALIWPMVARRRDEAATPAPRIGEPTRDLPNGRAPGNGYSGGPYDLQPAYGDNETRRERSGALR